jgi:hypothetical protein
MRLMKVSSNLDMRKVFPPGGTPRLYGRQDARRYVPWRKSVSMARTSAGHRGESLAGSEQRDSSCLNRELRASATVDAVQGQIHLLKHFCRICRRSALYL